jgi:hypothetical protein
MGEQQQTAVATSPLRGPRAVKTTKRRTRAAGPVITRHLYAAPPALCSEKPLFGLGPGATTEHHIRLFSLPLICFSFLFRE